LTVGQTAQRRHPNLPDSYRVIGMALHRLNRLEEARQVLHQAITIDPYTQATRAEYQEVLNKLAAKT
ncbi:MAG TPA: tetratricopeptide repeat protein, partial [Tepidisphaeraceae bacterium]|nr:tetratricopeptide repeat protein [Tepidisphaeraceae bacterium]